MYDISVKMMKHGERSHYESRRSVESPIPLEQHRISIANP